MFGEKPSVGKICGIAESVIDSTTPTTIPGYCCLDTPAESDAALGGVWGQPYKCEHECQNKGPYLSGMTVETCDIYGGQWCQNPVDCSQLQECVAVYLQDAIDNDRTAWATYLESSPSIKDPLDSFECGRAREYFGFEATFINDRQICQDIGQLRNTNDLAILEGFFAGSDGDGDGPDFSLTPPQTPEETTGFSAEGGLAWRASNFALSQAGASLFQIILIMLLSFLENSQMVSCPFQLTLPTAWCRLFTSSNVLVRLV